MKKKRKISALVVAGFFVCLMLIPSLTAEPEGENELPFWHTEGNHAGKKDVLGTLNNRDLRIVTNGEQRMVITSEGNVGIGVLDPQYRLDVDGDARVSGTLHIGDDGESNLVVAPSGNVGIGTPYPTEALDVVGNVHTSGAFIAGSTTTYGDGYISFSSPETYLNIDEGTLYIEGVNNRVGIGTTVPDVKLDVELSGAFGTVGGAATIGHVSNSATGDYAIAMGYITGAGGHYSTAMGYITEANGHYSTAMGYYTKADKDYSTAMGAETTASGEYSTAMGRLTTANGESSTAMGFFTNAYGEDSTAMGDHTEASEFASTAMGSQSTASGIASTAMGENTEASGRASTAMGQGTTAKGHHSTAIGNQITVEGVNSVGIGLDQTPQTVFQNNVLAIMGGNVGIGTVSPQAKLGVELPWGGPGTIGGAATIGHANSATGDYAIAMGYQSEAGDFASMAMGSVAIASGYVSTAMGQSTTASGHYSTAMGRTMTADGENSFGIGLDFNFPNWEITQDHTMAIMGGDVGIGTVSPIAKAHIVQTDGADAFRVDDETSDTTPFVIDQSGNVGIGTSSPTTKLHVNGVITATVGTSTNWNTAYGWGDHALAGYDTTTDSWIGTGDVYTTSGNVGIGTTTPIEALDVDGNIHASGTFIAGSTTTYGNGVITLSPGTNLDINTGSLFIDNANDRVGIGTTSPQATLDVDVVSGPAVSIGKGNLAIGSCSIAMGENAEARKANSIAMGYQATAGGLESLAIGWRANATGYKSTAIGYLTMARGSSSVAIGPATTAWGDRSTSIGHLTNASGVWSTAIGVYSTATGDFSYAMGYDTKANGFSSTAMGFRTIAEGFHSTTMGAQTTAYGNYSTAMGYGTTAYGNYSTAMGYNTNAYGNYSTAMGRDIIAQGKYSFGIGLNHPTIAYKIENDNTMAIMGGNVGIGTVSPENALHVNGAINLDPIDEPANPSTGFVIYVDGADGDLKAKSSTGDVTVLATD